MTTHRFLYPAEHRRLCTPNNRGEGARTPALQLEERRTLQFTLLVIKACFLLIALPTGGDNIVSHGPNSSASDAGLVIVANPIWNVQSLNPPVGFHEPQHGGHSRLPRRCKTHWKAGALWLTRCSDVCAEWFTPVIPRTGPGNLDKVCRNTGCWVIFHLTHFTVSRITLARIAALSYQRFCGDYVVRGTRFLRPTHWKGVGQA